MPGLDKKNKDGQLKQSFFGWHIYSFDLPRKIEGHPEAMFIEQCPSTFFRWGFTLCLMPLCLGRTSYSVIFLLVTYLFCDLPR